MHFLLGPNESRPTGAILTLLLMAAPFLSGCGENHHGLPEGDYNRAKEALAKALQAWKNGEKPTKWTKKNVPIRFVDDAWLRGSTLVEFEIVELRANVDKAPEAMVKLQLRSKKGEESEREALYGINLKLPNQIAIGRDPMH